MSTATKAKLPKLAQPTNGKHEPDEKIVVRFNPNDMDRWSGRMIRDFESVQPTRFVNLIPVMRSGVIPWDTILGILWILHREVDPTLTFDDVLDMPTERWEAQGLTVAPDGSTDDPTEEPAETTGS